MCSRVYVGVYGWRDIGVVGSVCVCLWGELSMYNLIEIGL